MAGRKTPQIAAAPAVASSVTSVPAPVVDSGIATERPTLSSGVSEFFVRGKRPVVNYGAAVAGLSKLHFVDAKAGVDQWVSYVHVAPFTETGTDVSWEAAQVLEGGEANLNTDPVKGTHFYELPAGALRSTNYEAWAKTLKTWLYQTVCLELRACPSLKRVAAAGESEGDFRARLG